MCKDKLKAFAIHLGISIVIALVAMSIVYLVWNPYPLFKATGITKIFLLMLAIDITLGPFLTFIVYKKGKKTLKLDLFVIAILQIAALTYGLYNVYMSRPAWIVYSVDRFDLVRVNEIDPLDINKAKPEYQKPPLTGPKFIAAVVPDNTEDKNEALFDELTQGIAPSQKPKFYQSLDSIKDQMVKKALPLNKLKEFNNKDKVESILLKYPQAQSYLPLKANATDMVVLVNDEDKKVIKIVDLRPWS